jgi:hypothetical protein
MLHVVSMVLAGTLTKARVACARGYGKQNQAAIPAEE